jgi:hypothetical protein
MELKVAEQKRSEDLENRLSEALEIVERDRKRVDEILARQET